MVTLLNETIVPLYRAGDYLPRQPNGRKVCRTKLWRWPTKGVRGGIVLESFRMGGGTVHTSREALERFIAPCSVNDGEPITHVFQREREAEAAEEALAKVGI